MSLRLSESQYLITDVSLNQAGDASIKKSQDLVPQCLYSLSDKRVLKADTITTFSVIFFLMHSATRNNVLKEFTKQCLSLFCCKLSVFSLQGTRQASKTQPPLHLHY